ncbi:MAG: hypothetical protein K0S45_2971 [Nitrospira sp.]|jgi:hypothetical protein|nr:hypothetical protein [Nitrospira sp.]
MFIEQAGLCDTPAIMRLVTVCIEGMRARGIYQWDEIYPNLRLVEDDIRMRSLFATREKETWIDRSVWTTSNPKSMIRYHGVARAVGHWSSIGYACIQISSDVALDMLSWNLRRILRGTGALPPSVLMRIPATAERWPCMNVSAMTALEKSSFRVGTLPSTALRNF